MTLTEEEVIKACRELYDEYTSELDMIRDTLYHFFSEERVDFIKVDMPYLLDAIMDRRLNSCVSEETLEKFTEAQREYKVGYIMEDSSGFYKIADKLSIIKDMKDRKDSLNNVQTEYSKSRVMIWFPHVKVTNENGASTELDNLYARFYVYPDGRLCNYFRLNRTDYTVLHMINDYMHSHIDGIPKGDFTEFKSPCLGTGPILKTQESLVTEFNIYLWELFSVELAKYVTVESLAGVPYRHIDRLSYNRNEGSATKLDYCKRLLSYSLLHLRELESIDIQAFIISLVQNNVFHFLVSDNTLQVGRPYKELFLDVSDRIINYINNSRFGHPLSWYVENRIITYGMFDNRDRLVVQSPPEHEYDRYKCYIGKYVLTFKGERKYINITDIDKPLRKPDDGIRYYINPMLLDEIIQMVIQTINYTLDEDRNKTDELPGFSQIRFIV